MTDTQTPPNALPTVYQEPTGRNHFLAPPPRRVGALGLARSEAGDVLMCEKAPTHEIAAPWYHLGGAAEANEDFRAACARITRAKLGITVRPGRLLAVHHMLAEEHVDPKTSKGEVSLEGVNFIFDCGVIPADTKFDFGGGVIGIRWFTPSELGQLAPFAAARTLAALRALDGGEVEFLVGHPQ